MPLDTYRRAIAFAARAAEYAAYAAVSTERQLCRYVRAPGMRRLAFAATMAADTAVRDSIVPLHSASRLPELGPHGEGWLVLQLLLGAAIAGSGFVGVYWPGSLESFFAVLGLLIAVVGAPLVVLGVLSLGRSFTPLPRPRARLRHGGIFRLVRHPVYGARS
jgi:protein-S-isoprenylcysteine O-methyltransferase Ste14